MKGLVIEGFLLFREGPRIRVALLHMKMWFISNVFDRVVDLSTEKINCLLQLNGSKRKLFAHTFTLRHFGYQSYSLKLSCIC